MAWYNDLAEDRRWSTLWSGYIRCPSCGGIRRNEGPCDGCGGILATPEPELVRLEDGTEKRVIWANMGAEVRHEDYVYLMMMEREWKRVLTDEDRYLDLSERARPSPRASVVLVFWAYFETRVERLLWDATRVLPTAIANDLLKRYVVIGARMDQLYKILFSTTYWDDLVASGFQDLADLLRRTQVARNGFTHGDPAAITDSIVQEVVDSLKREHEGWIAVFNKRATRPHYWQGYTWPKSKGSV